MASLICCLSTGKGTWLKVMDVIKATEWDKIYIITNDFGKVKFNSPKPAEFIVINPDSKAKDIIKDIKDNFNITDFEVALNIDSGSGKEHMAVISAIIQLGLSIRFVSYENNELVEITPYDN
ncbi:MAG: hypothetical protein ACOCZQ_00755 [Nanoarchaeota archaeon]